MFIKQKLKNIPSLRITLIYVITALIVFFVIYLLLPTILNYGPESINTNFDVQMSYISYTQQFSLIVIAVTIALYITSHFLLRDIDKWYSLDDSLKYSDTELIKKIRKKCFNLPYLFFAFEVIVPSIFTIVFLFITGSHHTVMVIKIITLIISLLLLLAVCSFIFAKQIYTEILQKTYSANSNLGYRINLTKKIFIQILPIFITGILVTSSIGYSRIIAEKEDIYFNVYHSKLLSVFDTNKLYTYDEVLTLLNNIELVNENDSKFIIDADDEIKTIYGSEVDNFVKEYTIQISNKYNGRTYDSYGVDTQGSTIQLQTAYGTIYVGILYNVESINSLLFYIINLLLLFILTSFVLYIFGRSLSNDLIEITTGFNNIAKGDFNVNNNLPVVSNDEIGDLVVAFNEIQKQQADYLTQIKNNQNMLIEQGRLASLGQLIGGISHNLKTPIMSISGAAEGLTDLINEYDASIGDPEVTNDDNHAIANDMRSWIEKIHTYTAYMSDIISAVKGQAVTLSESEQDTFPIDELVKRVKILMKNEIQNAHASLNVTTNNLDDFELHGNVNSLVQVVNNLVANAIQAYRGQPEGIIDLAVEKEEQNIVISIEDHGCGMPKDVQDKLFKEMITTKGKNGTGLGMFMSYSTIKGKFDGDITFTTQENVGTKFNIILPIKQ